MLNPRLPLAAMLALALTACKQEDFSAGVVLEIGAPEPVMRPEFLELDWLDGTKGLFKGKRVPESGTLVDDGRPYLAKVVVALAGEDPVPRRAIVRGTLPGDRVLIGRRRFEARVGFIVPIDTVVVAMKDLGTIDADGDGVPNDIDVCPGADDFAGCAAGIDAAPTRDAAVPDASVDARDAASSGVDAGPAADALAAGDGRG